MGLLCPFLCIYYMLSSANLTLSREVFAFASSPPSPFLLFSTGENQIFDTTLCSFIDSIGHISSPHLLYRVPGHSVFSPPSPECPAHPQEPCRKAIIPALPTPSETLLLAAVSVLQSSPVGPVSVPLSRL